MAIKVIVNYPETEEGWKEYYSSQSKAILSVLRERMSPKDLDNLIAMLIQKVANDKLKGV